MDLLSFNAYRSLGIPGARYIRPDNMFARRDELLAADWILFPETWQVNALVYSLRRRIFPALAGYHLGRDKVEMARAFQAFCAAHVPETLILPATGSGVEEVIDTLGFPVVVKEPRSARGEGVALLRSAAELRAWAATHEVLLAQEYLPIDKDLRVVWIGDRVVTAYWRSGGDGFRHNLARGGRIQMSDIPARAIALVENVAPALGLDHAGFDIAMIGGHPYLLEFNLLFGNEALNHLGIRLGPIIHDYLVKRWAPAPDLPWPDAG
ncbi:MAG: hypothetical protein PVI56_03540 [Gammaproteobacteria bacterium]|jgi:ribosomal protein S6--L-glutamate ligase